MKIKLSLWIALLCITFQGFSQNNFWVKQSKNNVNQEDLVHYETQVSRFDVYQLDVSNLVNTLNNAPLRFEQNLSNVTITFPYSNGKYGQFEMFEVQTLHPELAANYPGIKSYVGKSREGNADRLRLTVTPHGIYGKIFSPQGSVYINPYTYNGSYFKVFYMADASFPPLVCHFEEQLEEQANEISSFNDTQTMVDDSTFRTYSFAGSATGEYSTYHVNQAGVSGGTDAQKKAAVLAAMTASLDRVNGITENDAALSFQFFSQTDVFIFLNPATDPFSNPGDAGVTLNENIGVTSSASSSFDIGHVFSTAGGGLAALNSICNNNTKAGGVTGPIGGPAVGDSFDLVLAHEIGHQLGATHTFNNSCGGNRTNSTAFETGNGVTIMSYSINGCAPAVSSEDYDHYHAASLTQIFNRISNTNCAQTTNIANTAPSITPLSNYVIPKQTPFILDVFATDAEGDQLTYNWEQYDNEITTQPPVAIASGGPMFRGYNVTTSSSRVFPALETVLNNQTQTTWEVLPSVARDMNFVVTVRDNNLLGGQNEQDFTTLTVTNDGPFVVTSQNTTGIVWDAGTTETITWNVNGTDTGLVNATNVDILLSTNGGFSFDHVLASATPNDGTHDITVPFGVVGDNCRLMIRGTGNVFFAVNQEEFNVNATCENSTNSSNVSIPDGAGFFDPIAGTPAESVITLTENGLVASLNVQVDISHANLSDVEIELESPDGQIVKLLGFDICQTEGIEATFDAGGNQLPIFGCEDVITGTFQPVEDLTLFNNGNINGDWKLRVTDFLFGNTGTINSWSIEVCRANSISTTSFEESLFSLYPNPASEIVNIKLNKYTKGQYAEIFDLNGRLVKSIDLDNSSVQAVDIRSLNNGIYLFKLTQGNKTHTEKIIVK
jgi:subtilisin-like proprotein convertase family protein